MANPNLVRKPSDSPTGGAGEITPAQVLDVGPNDQNYIINGGFDFWQRALSAAIGGEVNGPMDRWAIGRSTGVTGALSAARSTDVPSNGKSTYSLGVTVTGAAVPAAADRWGIFQKIEGSVIAPLYNEKATLSFWVKSSVVGTYSVWFGNGAGNNGYYVTSYTINVANTWEQKSITVDFSNKVGTWSTDSSIGMYVYFALATGSTFNIATPNVWSGSSAAGLSVPAQANLLATGGNTFLISQVMLNRGTIASPFTRHGRHHTGEFLACLRYFEKSYNVDQFAGDPSAVGAIFAISFNATDTYTYGTGAKFKVTKRAVPSITFWAPGSGSGGVWYDLSIAANNNGVGMRYPGVNGIDGLYYANNNMQTNHVTACHWYADAEL